MATALPEVEISGWTYQLHLNPGEEKPSEEKPSEEKPSEEKSSSWKDQLPLYGDRFSRYAATATGVCNLSQLFAQISRIGDAVYPEGAFKGFSAMFDQTWTGMIFCRTLSDLFKKKEGGGPTTLTWWSRTVRDTADMLCNVGYSTSKAFECAQKTAVLSSSILGITKKVNFVHDVLDGAMSMYAWNAARVAASQIPETETETETDADKKEVRENLVKTQTFHTLKMFKAATSIAGVVLGMYMGPAGLLLPGAMVKFGLPLCSKLLAVGADLYKAKGYKPVDFFNTAHVKKEEV